MWKSIGTIGISKIINHEFDLADFAREYVIGNENYKTVIANFIPPVETRDITYKINPPGTASDIIPKTNHYFIFFIEL